MNPEYYIALALLACGAVVGLFLRPVVLLKLGTALFALAIVGVVVSGAASQNTLTWVFGLSAMAIPFVSAVVVLGAIAGGALKRALGRKNRK